MNGRKMKHIVFQYRDAYSRGQWVQQECIVPSVEYCKKLYGLGKDCEYKIVKVEDAKGY